MLPNLLKLLIPEFKPPKNIKGEAAICMDIATYLRHRSLSDASFPFLWFHVPNQFSGRYKGVFGALMTWMGRISGVPDYAFMGKDGCFFIEVKTQKGSLSETQKLFREWCLKKEVPYHVCKSVKDVEEVMSLYVHQQR